jgi:CheY-like chemotaxis protein
MSINGGARILVVDDEPQIRRFLSASLNSHEYTVIEAHTGNEAIRRSGSTSRTRSTPSTAARTTT